jgi:hypothetical protein
MSLIKKRTERLNWKKIERQGRLEELSKAERKAAELRKVRKGGDRNVRDSY